MVMHFEEEINFLVGFNIKAITISTTAKHAVDFTVLPRRGYNEIGMSSFMVNDESKLKELLSYFDGEVDYIFIDIELKQTINLSKIAQDIVVKSKLITIKPNDTTLESLDLLTRKQLKDNLLDKNILVIGTGNLASKIATRLAERQANVYLKGRNKDKENIVIDALNLFLPANNEKIKPFEANKPEEYDVVISAISGEFQNEALLKPLISQDTLFIDVGINNFNSDFIQYLLQKDIDIIRLDTRIALPYQLLMMNAYTEDFFESVIGQKVIDGITVVAGGIVGKEGEVILDKLVGPTQVIGIADGSGGVKQDGKLTNRERKTIQTIKSAIL